MKQQTIKLLQEKLIYTSSTLEGIEISKAQVRDIVRNGSKSKYLNNNPANSLLQAYGQKQALDLIEIWGKSKKVINTKHLLEIHYTVFNKIDSKAGRYREAFVKLTSSKLMTSFPYSISSEMYEFNNWLLFWQKENKSPDIRDIVILTAKCYHEINKIHPFIDGNGRSARLFVNLLLRKYKYPYIVIPKSRKTIVMKEVLKQADAGDPTGIVKFFSNLLNTSLRSVKNLEKLLKY